MITKKYTLVEAYDMLTLILGEVRRGVTIPGHARTKITELAENVNGTIPGVIIKVPTLSELYLLVPQTEPEFESSGEDFESSYESSQC